MVGKVVGKGSGREVLNRIGVVEWVESGRVGREQWSRGRVVL